jgi:plasmid stabilization system protein ParE
VNQCIQESAEQDILSQVEWYARQGLPGIARRFRDAAMAAIDMLMTMPEAGPPKVISNPDLEGLRAWPIKGFDAFWVY